ncbi:MAG: choline-sulfatase [Kiloniellales bacterium]|nr:choline-sulfatase [Kiloniellales bacterium]
MSRQANIVFIMADQLAAPALPAYGHKVVKAPHIQGLAERGVVFDAAYCNSPLCAPSRFSMLSGRLPSDIGAYDNATEFPATVPTFAHMLRLGGYRTILSGKMHFVGPDQLHGFEERLTTDIYPADFGWTADWERPDRRQHFYHTMLSVVEAEACRRSQQIDFDEEVAYQAERKIYDLARDGDDRPFFLLVSFTHPHDPYTIGQEFWDLYRPEEIDLPSAPALAPEEMDPHSRRLFEALGMKDYALTEERIRKARRAYYGAISYVDAKVGRLLESLEAAGLAEDSIVVFTADHGDMLGERGLWYKMCFYEWAARVPLIVAAPERFEPRRIDCPVSLIDVFPTLQGLGGLGELELPEDLPGSSLLPLLEGGEGGPEAVHGEYLGEAAAGPLIMIRRGRHKYVVGIDSPPQLFDLAEDPNELNNLSGQASVAEIEGTLAEEAGRRWELEGLRAEVIANQRRRRFVQAANLSGVHTPWDFQPIFDASESYARNTRSILGDLENRARLPYRESPAPDGPGASSAES